MVRKEGLNDRAPIGIGQTIGVGRLRIGGA
jgi:hypothetical protein